MGIKYNTKIIRAKNELITYQKEMDKVNKAKSGSIFSSVGWLINWADTHRDNILSLAIILVFDENTLIGFAPFYIENNEGVNTLLFCGSSMTDKYDLCPEYMDVVIETEYGFIGTKLVLDALFSIKGEWDQVRLKYLLSTSIINQYKNVFKSAFMLKTEDANVRYSIDLPIDFDAYVTNASPSFKKKIKRTLSKYKKMSEVSCYLIDNPSLISSEVDDLFSLHNASWNEKGLPGAFSRPEFNTFHRQFISNEFLRSGVRLFVLKDICTNDVIGVIYGFLYNRVFHYYQSGFNADAIKGVSIGTLSHLLLIQKLMAKGECKSYDFMRGKSEGSYKSHFANNEAPMISLTIVKRNWFGYKIFAKWFLKRIVEPSQRKGFCFN